MNLSELLKLTQQQAKQWYTNQPLLAEELLEQYPHFAGNPEAAVEIIYTEFVLRCQSNQKPTPEEYIQKFPRYRQELSQLFELHQLLSSSWLEPWSGSTERPSVPNRLRQGERSFNHPRFELMRRIGSGGMGVVYAAEDRLWVQQVALKTVRDWRASLVGNLKAEFRTLADLSHPNLISLYELFVQEDLCFFTMELLDGDALLNYVRPQGKPILPRIEEILRQAVRGISFLHQRRVLHRDIKPSNFLVTQDDRCILLDFGLAVDLPSQRARLQSGSLVGTEPFFAPELWSGESYTEATDWYALGVTLYQASTGELPTNPLARGVDLFHGVSGMGADLQQWCAGLLSVEVAQRLKASKALCHWAEMPLRHELLHSSERTELPGREQLLDELASRLEKPQRGNPQMVLLAGESGIGKTTVLSTFLQRCNPDWLILSSRCHPCESVPFKAMDAVIEALACYLGTLGRQESEKLFPPSCAALLSMFPCLAAVAPARAHNASDFSAEKEVDRQNLFGMLKELLRAVASRKKLIIAIDDLQWSDEDSTQLLKALLLGPETPWLFFIGAYRPQEVVSGSELEALLSGSVSSYRSVERICTTLEPLPDKALEQILAASTFPPTNRETLIQACGGNPFILQELRQLDVAPSSATDELSPDDLIWQRVRQLGSSSEELLLLLSLSGKAIRQKILFEAFQRDDPWQESIHTVRKLGYLRVSASDEDGLVEIGHDRIRETLLARVDAQTKQSLHLRLAKAIEQLQPDDFDALCFHFEGAQHWNSAADYAESAAAAATGKYAFRRAAELYRKVVHWRSQQPEATLSRLREELGLAEARAGYGRLAAEQFLLLSEYVPEQALRFRRMAMHQLVCGGQYDEALQQAEWIAKAVGLSIPKSDLEAKLKLLWESLKQSIWPMSPHQQQEARLDPAIVLKTDCLQTLSMSLMTYRAARGSHLSLQFQKSAFRGGTKRQIAHAFAQRAGTKAVIGKIDRRVEQDLELAYRFVDDDPSNRALCAIWEYYICMVQGRWRECLELGEQTLRLPPSDDHESWFVSTLLRAYRWTPCFFAGEIGEIRRRFWSWFSDAKDRDDAFGKTILPLDYGILYWLAADQPDEAQAMLNQVKQAFPNHTEEVLSFRALISEISIALYRGDGRNAWLQMRNFCSKGMPFGVRYNGLIRPLYLQIRGASALSATSRENEEVLKREIIYCQRQLSREQYAWNHSQASLLTAGLALLQRNVSTAIQHYEQAERDFELAAMPLHAAVCRRRRGQFVQGEHGASLMESADTWMLDQSITNPAAICDLIAPLPKTLD